MEEEYLVEIKVVDFGNVPVDIISKKTVSVQNLSSKPLTYRISSMYVINCVDNVFKVSITSAPVQPLQYAELVIEFRANIPGQSFTEYFIVDDTDDNVYRLTVTGKCYGPKVELDRKKITFKICKNMDEDRKADVNIINKSSVETTYRWFLPVCGHGHFQISSGTCGLIKPFEQIKTTVLFTGTSLGVYTAELVCLILNHEPLYLHIVSTVYLAGTPEYMFERHVFDKGYRTHGKAAHFMENCLSKLTYIPSASVYDKFLDFGNGSIKDIKRNVSLTLTVTNHLDIDGEIEWIPDPDNVFLIDPLSLIIPPQESRMFTVRFRPRYPNVVYGYLMCGDFQVVKNKDDVKHHTHTWFRIPCMGNTWEPCTEWVTQWGIPIEVTLPPTVPAKPAYTNFMLYNRLDVPMYFRFFPPGKTNYAVMPMCGIVPSRGWEIISLALEPNDAGFFVENWDITINNSQKASIRFMGTSEQSSVEIMSPGYNPSAHAMFEFPATITNTTNYCTAYLHNLTRMSIHIRVVSGAPWLGADDSGVVVIPPKQVARYHWWFFPDVPNKVYDTIITCSCVCLIDDRPVGEPSELFVHLFGFSELPDLRVLPNHVNLHDITVSEKRQFKFTLFNYCSCLFTSKLYYTIDGMGDDHSGERVIIDTPINSLNPSNYCELELTVTPNGAGSRQIDIKYTVLYRSETELIEEIQPITKTICRIWYDAVYPTFVVKRTIALKCPLTLSNHCVWKIMNVDALNTALHKCRPNIPYDVQLYAPDLCVAEDRASDLYITSMIFILGGVYRVPVLWSLQREKICDCPMVEVQKGISTFEMRHSCIHRIMAEITPTNGIVTKTNLQKLKLKFNYSKVGHNRLLYVLRLSNQRSINMYINVLAYEGKKGVLCPLRRHFMKGYLAVLDCGRVPINNLDPVVRLVWLYNPTQHYTTWRLLRARPHDQAIRCLLFFAEVAPFSRVAIPFSFMPTEMIAYECTFYCSFGYETVRLLVRGEGGLPNCWESRLDMPLYTEYLVRSMCREKVVYLSAEHVTTHALPTRSLTRELISINNDTDHTMRFIWLPERIPNVVNIVMTPCWGVLPPKSVEWITMTVYTLQDAATFTTMVTCELLDLTMRRKFQQNELLYKFKMEKCKQEFIITEDGMFHPGINDAPPFALDLNPPEPQYITMTVSVNSLGQRDAATRLRLRQMWEQVPAYDLLSSDYGRDNSPGNNNMSLVDVIRIIDCILWESLHSKMFKCQLGYYCKEELPTYSQLMQTLTSKDKPSNNISKRATAGICDAIVNKAVYHVYGLHPKHQSNIMEV